MGCSDWIGLDRGPSIYSGGSSLYILSSSRQIYLFFHLDASSSLAAWDVRDFESELVPLDWVGLHYMLLTAVKK